MKKAIVELVAMIALENMRARFNRALEIPSDGLCRLPADHTAMRAAAAGPNPFPYGKGRENTYRTSDRLKTLTSNVLSL